jgi:hypothetical protein
MIAMNTIWNTAPATCAVRDYPAQTLQQARQKMDQWSEQVRLIDDLLGREDVSATDKMTLSLEKASANCCLMACANIITACEERMREQAKRMEEKWGWLL